MTSTVITGLIVIGSCILTPEASSQLRSDTLLFEWPIDLVLTQLSPVYNDSLVNFSGILLDSLTHERLVGGNVAVPGSRRGAASNWQGEFRADSLPIQRMVRISYVGYDIKSIAVRSLGTLSTQLPAPVVADSVLTHFDLVDVALIRRSLEVDLPYAGRWWRRDSAGGRQILLYDSLIQPAMVPVFPEGGYQVLSKGKLEELAMQAGLTPHGVVVFKALGNISRGPTARLIRIREVVGEYWKREKRVLFRVQGWVEHRYRLRSGQWVEGPQVISSFYNAEPLGN